MKELSKILFCFGIVLFFAFSCEEEENSDLITFKFRVLDDQGTEKSTFNEGDNVIFSLLVTNLTNQDVYFYHEQMDLSKFFSLVKLNTPEGDLDLGKPYFHIFCDKIGALRIPANDSLDIVVPWLNTETFYQGYNGCEATDGEYHKPTETLSVGDYMSEFSSSFKIDENIIDKKDFEVRFKIN